MTRSIKLCLYRQVRAQCLDLARRATAYKAQDPAVSFSTVSHAPDFHDMLYDAQYDSDTVEHFTPYSSMCDDDVSTNSKLKGFKIASLNFRGLASISKRERIVHLMMNHGIDILCLQETKINSNSKEVHDGYEMYWSSDVTDTDRNTAEILARSGRATTRNEMLENMWG